MRSFVCAECFDGRVSAKLAEELISAAADGHDGIALHVVSSISDPGVVTLLERAANVADGALRAAVVKALGGSGGPEQVGLLTRLLRDPAEDVRREAAASLVEIGGDSAADALVAALPGESSDEQVHLICCLAELRDSRALPYARALVPGGLAWGNPSGVMWALVRLGGEGDLQRLREQLVDRSWLLEYGDRSASVVQDLVAQWWELRGHVGAEHPEGVPVIDEAFRRYGLVAHDRVKRETVLLHPRKVPRLGMSLTDVSPESDPPRAKFGGQPDWIAEPQWPVHQARKLTFFGQLPIYDQPGRFCYIFLGDFLDEGPGLTQGNALVVQPGGTCEFETVGDPTGPRLFGTRRQRRVGGGRTLSEPYERFVTFTEGLDPQAWDLDENAMEADDVTYVDQDGDWEKLGGTPRWLQNPEEPSEPGWHFAFQFGADWAGRELADGANCYGFVHEDGRGKFIWQCH